MTNRAKPQPVERERILIEQRGCCLYCLRPLDAVVYHGTNEIMLRLEWDHKVPFSFLRASPRENWAAACNVCNSLKGNLHFHDVQEAREYLSERWATKGYSDKPLVPEPLPEEPPLPPKRCAKCGAEYGPEDDRRRKYCTPCYVANPPASFVYRSTRRKCPHAVKPGPNSVLKFCRHCRRNHLQLRSATPAQESAESNGEAFGEGAPHDLT
jgi:hypothetical protein